MPALSLLRCTLLASACACPLVAQHDEPERLELRAPISAATSTDDTGLEKWLSCRIVDAITGKPLPDAEVLLMAEQATPVGGELTPAMRLEADDDGFVSARIDERADGYAPWNWLCARAPGYGQQMRMDRFDHTVIRLTPAFPVRVQVRDWADRPVAGALVGFCSGCGHTQDLVHGTTGEDGGLTLTDIDLRNGIADFYVVHRDLKLGYLSPDWYPSRRPMVLRVGPGVPHEGVLVGANGAPIAGAAVGLSERHRGPWARSRADGTFQLFGLDARTDLWVHVDGWRFLFEENGVEHMRLALPPMPEQTDDPTEVLQLTEPQRQRRDQQREHAQQLWERREQSWPRVAVRTVDLPEGGRVELRTRRRSWDLDDAIEIGAPVALPDDAFVFCLKAEGDQRIVPGDRARAIADGFVRLHWYRPTRVEGRLLDAFGYPANARVAITDPGTTTAKQWHRAKGALSLATTESGTRWLLVRDHLTGSLHIRTIELPERGDDAFVDVGTLTLDEEPAYRFERPDGSALVDGSVRLLRAGWTRMDRGWKFEADADGNYWLPPLRPGDALLVRSTKDAPEGLDGAIVVDLPSRFVIGETPQRVFRMHAGELRLEVRADDDTPFATIGDRVVPLRGATVVRGLPPDTYRILLGAYAHDSARVEVEVTAPKAAGQRRWLRASLPRR